MGKGGGVVRDELLRVVIEGGKYTVVLSRHKGLEALRYGEPWRELAGDNLVLCLAQEIERLREQLAAAEQQSRSAANSVREAVRGVNSSKSSFGVDYE